MPGTAVPSNWSPRACAAAAHRSVTIRESVSSAAAPAGTTSRLTQQSPREHERVSLIKAGQRASGEHGSGQHGVEGGPGRRRQREAAVSKAQSQVVAHSIDGNAQVGSKAERGVGVECPQRGGLCERRDRRRPGGSPGTAPNACGDVLRARIVQPPLQRRHRGLEIRLYRLGVG